MIRVTFTEPNTKPWLRWRKDVTKAVAQLVTDAAANSAITISGSLYKRRKEDIFEAFAKKCAYCESDLQSQHGDVEHYRPKQGVTDLGDAPVSLQIGGQSRAHPGYFWIAYDPSNLLPSCAKCNQQPTRRPDGTLAGKGNRFPVAGTYGYDPADPRKTDLSLEQPLLLHPVLDEPNDHLLFLQETGALGWKTLRGEKTIEVFDLNKEWLRDQRLKTFSAVKNLFLSATAALLLGDEPGAATFRKQIAEFEEGRAAYAFAGRAGIIYAKARLQPLTGAGP
jgi:hypothetical protein